jgi:hypothetical protein
MWVNSDFLDRSPKLVGFLVLFSHERGLNEVLKGAR